MSTSNRPAISVVIPLYNHEHYIRETLQSVINQSHTEWEAVVVDDGSTDSSYEAAISLKDERIRTIRQQNGGTHSAINRGVEETTAPIIMVLNSDDRYHQDRMSSILDSFDSNNNIDAVFTRYRAIDGHGTENNTITEELKIPDQYIGNWSANERGHTLSRGMLTRNLLHSTSNLACKRVTFNRLNGIKGLKYVNDYDFFLRLTNDYNIGLIGDCLLDYRFHDSNTLNKSASASVLETVLVLAETILNKNNKWLLDEPQILTREVNLYGADRALLAIITLINNKILPDQVVDDYISGNNNSYFEELKSIIEENRNHWISLQEQAWNQAKVNQYWEETEKIKSELEWQQSQSEKWWRKSEKLSADLQWQQQQSESWWRTAEKNGQDLEWQKEQTDHWWQQTQELDRNLEWQKGETVRWRQAADLSASRLNHLQLASRHIINKRKCIAKVRRTQLIALKDEIRRYCARDQKMIYKLAAFALRTENWFRRKLR